MFFRNRHFFCLEIDSKLHKKKWTRDIYDFIPDKVTDSWKKEKKSLTLNIRSLVMFLVRI